MLSQLKEKLLLAEGRSEFVIIVFCDVRGFSQFCTRHESPDIAMFIKRFFINIIEKHFPNVHFVKPTGDGLLLVFPYNEHNLIQISNEVLQGCFSSLEDFPKMFLNDPIINFETPDRLGFGVTRGTACCLYSGEEILDYSGRILNLAARLNDMARPLGLVIDSNYQIDIIPTHMKERFKTDKVYVRGINENTPLEVLYSHQYTQISLLAKTPLATSKWEQSTDQILYTDLKKIKNSNYGFSVFEGTLKCSQHKLILAYDTVEVKGRITKHDIDKYQLIEDSGGTRVRFSTSQIVQICNRDNVPDSTMIKFLFEYQN